MNPGEYFLIEGRIKTEKSRRCPDQGLLIWHIDDSNSTNNNFKMMTPDSHYTVSVEQADNLFELEKGIFLSESDSGDLFHAGYNDCFTDFSSPNAKWWNGANSGLSILDISAVANVMTFKLPRVNFPAAQAIREDAGAVTLTAALSISVSRNVTVPFTVSGTASNPADHNLAGGNIVINAGDVESSVSFNIVKDLLEEPDETVIVTMGNPENAGRGPNSIYTATIVGTNSIMGERISTIPGTFGLLPNYPNPFNSTTKICFAVPSNKEESVRQKRIVTLAVYNAKGQCIRTLVDGPISVGYHIIDFNGIDDSGDPIAVGVYMVNMQTQGFSNNIRLIKLK